MLIPTSRPADPIYTLGSTAGEHARLISQADLLAPLTRQVLLDAGLRAGMRALDVGCGAGDVSLLAAELVGPGGEVVGIDRDPKVLATARARAADRPEVRFVEGDFREPPPGEPFDAVIGRLVLMYQADPVAAIRAVMPALRPGGIVAFLEYDLEVVESVPPGPTFAYAGALLRAAFARTGARLRMGPELCATFVAAALPAPLLQVAPMMTSDRAHPAFDLFANTIRSLLPMIERFGLATAAEIDVETLADRLRDEMTALGGCIVGPTLIGASTRKPA